MKTKFILKNGLLVLFLSFALASMAQQKITITHFNVIKEQNKISIKWAIDSTSESNYFEVERSNDGKNFKTVAYVLGADPTQKDCECFGCFDKINENSKTSYYRLKHVNKNGSIQLSEVKMLALK